MKIVMKTSTSEWSTEKSRRRIKIRDQLEGVPHDDN